MFNDDSLGFLMAQVVKANHIRMQALLGKLGLYPGQPPVLFMLWEEDGRTQTEFCDKLDLKPATVTVMLKRMEKTGLLVRKADPSDLRVSRVYLTEKGRNLERQVVEVVRTMDRECFDGFTAEEKVLLRRFFKHMRDNLIKSNQS